MPQVGHGGPGLYPTNLGTRPLSEAGRIGLAPGHDRSGGGLARTVSECDADRMGRPGRGVRVVASVSAAVACVQGSAAAAGLRNGRLVGVADNTDGVRLYRGTDLVPDTADGRSDWKGGVVVHFVRAEPGEDPIPSAALQILRMAAWGHREHWCLTRLGWAYALLAGGVAGAAVWAASAEPVGALALLPVLAPLANPDFARFFVSTYSEPAGLAGAAALLCGTAVLALVRPGQRAEHAAGLALAGGGGLLAVTAKVAYLPLLPVAAVVCAGTRTASGQMMATAITALAVKPVVAAWRWQNRNYPAVNTHNLIFTLLIPELGADAAVAVGLPESAVAYSGCGSSDARGVSLDPDLIPGWRSAIGADPGRARGAACRYLARHPKALARVVGVALQATLGRDLDYLRKDPLPPGVDRLREVRATGPMGHDADALQAWLDGLPAPWRPSMLVLAGIAAGTAALRWPPRDDLIRTLAVVAGTGAVGAVGVAAFAMVGDGYYEVAKHAWLSAYLLDVTAAALTGAAAASLIRVSSRRLSGDRAAIRSQRAAVARFPTRRRTRAEARSPQLGRPGS
jgi:hypothetical protein